MVRYNRLRDRRGPSALAPGQAQTNYNPVPHHGGSSAANQPLQPHLYTTANSQAVPIPSGPHTIHPPPQPPTHSSPPWPVELPRLQPNFTNKLKRDKPQSTITRGSFREVMESGIQSRKAQNQAGPLIQSLNSYDSAPQQHSPMYANQMEAGPSNTNRQPTQSYSPGFACQICTVPPFVYRDDLDKHMSSKHPGMTKARKHSNDDYMSTPLGASQRRGAY